MIGTGIHQQATAEAKLAVAEYVETYRKHPEVMGWYIVYLPGQRWSPLFASENQMFRTLGDQYKLVRNDDLKPPLYQSPRNNGYDSEDDLL